MSEKEKNVVEVETKGEEALPLTRQEENWRLMTILQIPWHHADQINDEDDRCFLVEKAGEVEKYLQHQQKQQEQMQQQMQEQQQQQIQPPQSNIITPFQ